ncbi:NAD(+) diphosphatase [Erythrobacter sp. THAF29]|uniref:NAD(+) diphosphatase n=1 Tax=Erythrobacter sp. THAF29 TaxID=2587851 RepID=UPI001268FF8C|nr:NAD(+) diphosphatase [Erythrobacter sp. THAF29]QFT78345.1 NADH pyrophosphatase [Erythrobacter sp. THAF29]
MNHPAHPELARTGPIAFAGSPIDRADLIRVNPEKLAEHMNWRAKVLMLDGLLPVIDDAGGLVWGTLADVDPDAELVFLGLLDERACFAVVPNDGATGPAYAMPRAWQAIQQLSPADLAIYGGARSLVDWHARHKFCARCGSPTKIAKGGWQRNCDSCQAQHFPRTDPVTIMLVENDGRLLLGRQPRFPPRAFSALAGFVEPGETIEEAVAREVWEEAGLRVRDVEYVATQPWPFPSQLMIGCYSQTDETEITLDVEELEEARWFTRDEVALAMDNIPTERGADGPGPFNAPPPAAIAHSLLRWWLEKSK